VGDVLDVVVGQIDRFDRVVDLLLKALRKV
jgi:hypothetical protein